MVRFKASFCVSVALAGLVLALPISGGAAGGAGADAVYSWGWNDDGQLDNGTRGGSYALVRSVGSGGAGFLTGVAALAGGVRHSLALKSDGSVVAWGGNAFGQLGDGRPGGVLAYSPTPLQVQGLTEGVAAIAAGGFESLALKADGTVLQWGIQQGFPYTPVPVAFPGSAGGVTAIASGDYFAANGTSEMNLALAADGGVFMWGLDATARPGVTIPPTLVAGIADAVAVAVNRYQDPGGGLLQRLPQANAGPFLALKSDGSVVRWDPSTAPTQVPGLSNIRQLALGGAHALALRQDGVVFSWGDNTYGELGNGTVIDNPIPLPVPGGVGIKAVDAGTTYSLALTSDGRVLAWGATYSDLLDQTSLPIPGPVRGLSGPVDGITAGYFHSHACIGPCALPEPLPFARSVSITEGDAGVTTVDIPVSLTASKSVPFSLKYTTKDDSAIAGSDYLPQTGVIAFAPGQKSQTVKIPVIGDTVPEETEKFTLELTEAATGALQASANITILDNDAALGGGDKAPKQPNQDDPKPPTKDELTKAPGLDGQDKSGSLSTGSNSAPPQPVHAQAQSGPPQASQPQAAQQAQPQPQPAPQAQAQTQAQTQTQVQQQVQVQTQGSVQVQPALMVHREKEIQAQVARARSGEARPEALLASALTHGPTAAALPSVLFAVILAFGLGAAPRPKQRQLDAALITERARSKPRSSGGSHSGPQKRRFRGN